MQVQSRSKALMIGGAICAALCAAAAAIACSSSAGTVSSTAPTAATVNGVSISEQEVTDTIERQRAQYGLSDDAVWRQQLQLNGYTPETFRESVIEGLAMQELVCQHASELGIEVDDSQVDEVLGTLKSSLGSDDAWESMLEEADYTEESYRAVVRTMLLQQAVQTHFEESAQYDEEEALAMAKEYAAMLDGSRRSSHILITPEDPSSEESKEAARVRAQELLGQINSGSISFEDAARENSDDVSSAVNGGDVGWDKAAQFVGEYQEALNGLSVGQVSGIVESQFGYHIIKCTDLYVAPETVTGVDQLPESIRDEIVTRLTAQAASVAYYGWLEQLRAEADIQVEDMPEDVPYNVGMGDSDASADGASGASSEN